MAVGATHCVESAAGVGGVALIRVSGDIDAALRSIGVAPVGVGEARLRDLMGVDEGLVVRWSASEAHLTPHGGARIVARLSAAMELAGIARRSEERWPEAADALEGMMLSALARAASAGAVDLLLAQPARWRSWDPLAHGHEETMRVSRALRRLIDPALVVAVGAPNVGKSTLLNALARREVALVADEPGVTRDHVGAMLELGGLVVRWVDTPGVREGGGREEVEARRIAASVVAGADLVVRCGDPAAGFVADGAPEGAMLVGLRADEGLAPGAELCVSAMTGEGMEAFARAVRRRLVPDEALAWEGPFVFDDRLCERLRRGLD